MSPWEKLKRGGLCYTTSRKEEGRVVREYVGTGAFAEQIAEVDALLRRLREQEARGRRWEREQLEALAAPVEVLCEGTRGGPDPTDAFDDRLSQA